MKLLDDYSFVRGVCHGPYSSDREVWKRDFGFCNRLMLNSIRMWMQQRRYETEGDAYVQMIKAYVHMANDYGITVMPIFFNGNAIAEFTSLTEEEWDKAYQYAKAMIGALKDEPAIIMWDVINEPMCCDYLFRSPKEEYEARFEKLTYWTRRATEMIKYIDNTSPITVGHELADHVHTTIDLVDVVSFHDYLRTRSQMENAIFRVQKLAAENGNKPILNTETGCVCRANPYDIELELCAKHKIGFYIFNLIIQGHWGDVHGVVYPDGTIRDPNIVAALMGFFRKRSSDRIYANPNREHHSARAIKRVEKVLAIKETKLHHFETHSSDEILEAAEYVVNQLEAAEMVPMWNPPSAQIACWRALPEAQRDIVAIRQFAYDMAQLLKKSCLL